MLSTRRKSCKACVRSKRRCDLGLPSCDRCIARKVSCEYPWADGSSTVSSQDFSWLTERSNGIENIFIHEPITVPRPLSPAVAALLDGLVNTRDTSLNF